LSNQNLLRPISEACIALVRSSVGAGWIERSILPMPVPHCESTGERVHLKDLMLHDAGHDIRTPTHELTIARDVLRSRRRIVSQPPSWALYADGLRTSAATTSLPARLHHLLVTTAQRE
jgi:K+-sensing histidine kinase KdpD